MNKNLKSLITISNIDSNTEKTLNLNLNKLNIQKENLISNITKAPNLSSGINSDNNKKNTNTISLSTITSESTRKGSDLSVFNNFDCIMNFTGICDKETNSNNEKEKTEDFSQMNFSKKISDESNSKISNYTNNNINVPNEYEIMSNNLSALNSNINFFNNYDLNSNSHKFSKNKFESDIMVKAPINHSPLNNQYPNNHPTYSEENKMDIENNSEIINSKYTGENNSNYNYNSNNISLNLNTNYNNANKKLQQKKIKQIANHTVKGNENINKKNAPKDNFDSKNNLNAYNLNVTTHHNQNTFNNTNNIKKNKAEGSINNQSLKDNSCLQNNQNLNNNNDNKYQDDNKENINYNNNDVKYNSEKNYGESVSTEPYTHNKFIPILQKYSNCIPLEYISDIWRSLKSSEDCIVCSPKFNQISQQTDVNFDMRAILIDWIIDVHKNYRLLPDTLFICVSIIDRYLSLREISRTKLQLLGTTALFISSKYEEVSYPPITEFSKVTDNAYTKEDILDMENEIMGLLNFDITYPSPFRFFEIISLNYNFSEVEFFYGSYLLESFLISPNCNKYFPSIIALATVLLILKVKKYENYHDLYILVDSVESKKLLKECSTEIYCFSFKCKQFNLFSVMNKYSSSQYHGVSENGFNNQIVFNDNNDVSNSNINNA